MNQTDLMLLWCKQYIDKLFANFKIPEAKPEEPTEKEPMFHIGFILTSSVLIDPEALYGGKWKRLEDVVILGASDKYPAGSTGGEAEVTLTVDEMPSHTHSVTPKGGWGAGSKGSNYFRTDGNNPANDWSVVAINSTGGSQPHNNMMPYYAAYMWERIE